MASYLLVVVVVVVVRHRRARCAPSNRLSPSALGFWFRPDSRGDCRVSVRFHVIEEAGGSRLPGRILRPKYWLAVLEFRARIRLLRDWCGLAVDLSLLVKPLAVLRLDCLDSRGVLRLQVLEIGASLDYRLGIRCELAGQFLIELLRLSCEGQRKCESRILVIVVVQFLWDYVDEDK